MPKGLLEQMRLEQPSIGMQQLVQSLTSFATDMSLPGQENELLAGQQAPKPLACTLELSLPNLVESFQEMANDVELVIDDRYARTVSFETVAKCPPHVHYRMGD